MEVSKEQALQAYNSLINYCSAQGNCDNCLFAMGEDSKYGDCIFESQHEPRGWELLDLD